MRKRRLGLLLAGASASATMLVSAPQALAVGQGGGGGGGATVEEFVCFRTTGQGIRIGTGKIITTPSGDVRMVCTGRPLSGPS